MTRLEFFEKGYAEIAMELGLLSPSDYMKYIHYKEVKSLIHQGFSKTQAVNEIAMRSECSETSVWRSVTFFE
jgi:hypothetical protein